MPPTVDTPTPRVPDYELLRLIGRGSYGDVWLARGVTGVFRAVKLVWRERFADLRPYEREFEGITRFTAVSLREPSQLALLHVGRDDAASYFYYVMELADDATRGRDIVPGEYVPLTLREVRERRGRLPAGEIVALGAALARALASLHATGLVHRDIKPSNIVFVGGVPKLADVGLVAEASAGLTFVGTEGFVPPEGPGAPAADVFSLGKVLYELATGLDRQEYPRLPADFGTWPDSKEFLELNEVLIRACEPNATARFPDAAALLEELLLLQAGKSVRRLRNAEKRTAQALRIAAVLALIASVAGVGAWIERQRANKELALREQAEAERDALARRMVYQSNLSSAQDALNTGDLPKAQDLLQEVVPRNGLSDLRGFEWHALWREAQGNPADVIEKDSGHSSISGSSYRVRFSSDYRYIAAQIDSSTVKVWEASSPFKKVFESHEIDFFSDFSTDGKALIGTSARTLKKWPLNGQEKIEQAGDMGGIFNPILALQNNTVLVATITPEKHPDAFAIYEFSTGAKPSHFKISAAADSQINFYRKGAFAATLNGRYCAASFIKGQGRAAIWRIIVYDTLKQTSVLDQESKDSLVGLAFTPNGERIALGFQNTSEVALLDLATKSWLWRRRVAGGSPSVLAFSNDGNFLAVGGSSSVLRIMRSHDGTILRELSGHVSSIESVAWGLSSTSLVSLGGAGDVRFWKNLQDSSPVTLEGLSTPAGGGRKLCLSKDGTLLAATDEETFIAETDVFKPRWRLPKDWTPVSFEDKMSYLLAIDSDGMIGQWGLGDQIPALLKTFRAFGQPVKIGSSVSTSLDGTTLVVGEITGQIAFCDLINWKRVGEPGHTENQSLYFVAISPNGHFALSGGARTPHVYLWNVGTRTHGAPITNGTAVPLCGAFSPESNTYAIGWDNGSVQIYDVQAGIMRHLTTHKTRSPGVHALAFSPDNNRLIFGSDDGKIHFINLDDGREILAVQPVSLELRTASVSGLAFSQNGNALAAYFNDGRIRLWRR